MLARLSLAAITLAIACAAGGCASPTLPLPPPSVELSLVDGEVTIEGSAEPGSLVYALNRDLGRGAIDTAREPDGHFTIVIEGSEGDLVVVWSQIDDERSPTVERLVPPQL